MSQFADWKVKLRRWYWRRFVPRPDTGHPDGKGFERLVEWCAIRQENETLWQCGGFEHRWREQGDP